MIQSMQTHVLCYQLTDIPCAILSMFDVMILHIMTLTYDHDLQNQ